MTHRESLSAIKCSVYECDCLFPLQKDRTRKRKRRFQECSRLLQDKCAWCLVCECGAENMQSGGKHKTKLYRERLLALVARRPFPRKVEIKTKGTRDVFIISTFTNAQLVQFLGGECHSWPCVRTNSSRALEHVYHNE